MRLEAFFANDLHFSSEQVLKSLGEGHAVPQATVSLKLDEDIHLAVRAGLPSHHGAEQANTACSVSSANPKHLRTDFRRKYGHSIRPLGCALYLKETITG